MLITDVILAAFCAHLGTLQYCSFSTGQCGIDNLAKMSTQKCLV